MNETAVLHIAATALAGVGVLTEGAIRFACFGLAIAAFVAGIVLARRDGGGPASADA